MNRHKIVVYGALSCLILSVGAGLALWSKPHHLLERFKMSGEVLQAATQSTQAILAVNIPGQFNETLAVQGLSYFQDDVIVEDANVDAGLGSVFASNLIYSVTGGTGITVTGDQDLTVSLDALAFLTSVVGQTGLITVGSGLSFIDNVLSNSDPGSAQNIFKNIAIGSNTITASSNNDTLTFQAGSNITLSNDGKTITIASSGGGESSPWTQSGTSVFLDTITNNVGIGTSTPTQALDIVGNLVLTGTTTLNSVTYIWPGSDAAGAGYSLTSDGAGNLSWTNIGSGSSVWQRLSGTLSPTNITDDVLIGGTATSSALVRLPGLTDQHAFFNLGVGNVGIGTSTPTGKLTIRRVDDTVQQDLRFVTNTGTDWKIYQPTGTSDLRFWNDIIHDDTITFDTLGNIGIGTTNPSNTKLEVYGSGEVRSRVSGTGGGSGWFSTLELYSDEATDKGWMLGHRQGALNQFWAEYFDGSTFYQPFKIEPSTPSNTLYLDSGGFVGIGMTNPTYNIDITGSLRVSGLTNFGTQDYDWSGATPQNDYILSTDASGNLSWIDPGTLPNSDVWQRQSGALSPLNITDDVLVGATATSSALVRLPGLTSQNAYFNLGTGNVGIGTTNPSLFKLQITGDIGPTTDDTYDLGSNTTRWESLFIRGLIDFNDNASNFGTIGTNAGGLYVSSGQNIILDLGGAVGATGVAVRNSSDLARIVLADNGAAVFGVNTTVTVPISGLGVTGAFTGKALTILNQTGDQAILAASTSGTTRFIIANDGNVGIGTATTSTSPLAISGLPTSAGTALVADGSGNVFLDSSSQRYKTNIQGLNEDFTKLLQAEPKSYNFISNGVKSVGYIAEDFDALGLTNLVVYDNLGRPDGIKYDRLGIYLLEIAKSQNSRLNTLQSSMNTTSPSTSSSFENLNSKTGSIQELKVDKLTVNEIVGLNASSSAIFDLGSGIEVDIAEIDFANINADLTVAGTTTLNELTVNTSISLEGDMEITGNSINTLSKPLEIQPLKQQMVSIMGGALEVKTDGTLLVRENALFEKDVSIMGTFTTQDLNVKKGTISHVSDTVSEASTSAGTAYIKSGQTERKIMNTKVQEDTLIYITPLSDTKGQTPYISEKINNESFTVKIKELIDSDIQFNFLIVGAKE